MNNHYHLLLSPLDDDVQNISRFMKKLNMGYAKFFNEKYSRSGYLWQGKYKKILVDKDNYFDYIPYYIHLNPLDFAYKEWREGGVRDVQAAYSALDNYRWSSYLDYNNKSNFPSLILKNLMQDILGDSTNQRKMIKSVISGGEQLHQTISKLIET
jgi:putative transposase